MPFNGIAALLISANLYPFTNSLECRVLQLTIPVNVYKNDDFSSLRVMSVLVWRNAKTVEIISADILVKVLHQLKQKISKIPLHKEKPKYHHCQADMEHLAYHCLP